MTTAADEYRRASLNTDQVRSGRAFDCWQEKRIGWRRRSDQNGRELPNIRQGEEWSKSREVHSPLAQPVAPAVEVITLWLQTRHTALAKRPLSVWYGMCGRCAHIVRTGYRRIRKYGGDSPVYNQDEGEIQS